jgi:hypothetical protein
MSTKHVVITGAGGFVGQRLTMRLLLEPAYRDARFALTGGKTSSVCFC